MAIDIGDAVLTFLGDTTKLDAAFDKVGTEAPAKLAPAEAAVTGLGESLQKTGVQGTQAVGTLADAFKLLPPVIAQTDAELQNMAFGLRNVAVAAEAAGEQSALAAVRGGEKLKVLEESFGVRLPRGVNRFISELIPLGSIMDAAFAASVVFIVIEALTKGIEKLVEWSQEAHKIALAHEEFHTSIQNSFNALDDKLLKSGARLDELRGDHMAALRKELELIDHQTLDDLVKEFDVLAKAADAVFEQLKSEWFGLVQGSTGAVAALKDFKANYDLLLAQGKDKEANDLLRGTLDSAQKTLDLMQKAKQLGELELPSGEGPVGPTPAVSEKELKSQEDLVAILNAQVEARKKINQEADNEKQIKNTEEANKVEAEQERALTTRLASEKKAADEEDARENKAREEYISNFQEREKAAIAATKQGSDERIRIIDAAIKEEEAHGFQDTSFFKSLQVQRVQAVAARIDQEQKAQQKADTEELKNAEESAKREVEAANESGNEQEKAISALGKFKLLSQTETSNRLIGVYEAEKTKVLAVLGNLLSEEKALMAKASKELADAKLNPGITPEQLQQAEQLLNRLKNAVANTETQIAKVKSDANAKELAADRSHYARALALAIGFGKQKLAEQLKENHAALVSAQGQLADAKARGVNTQAMQLQVKELQVLIQNLQKEEKTLEQSAHQGLSSWTQFSQGFRDQAEQNVKTIQQMSAEMEQDVQSFGTVISGAFEAMVSGQESFGKAMLHGTEKMIAQMAEQWGEYFLAKGIADIFFDPPLGGAELAAGAALMAIGGALSGLASGSSKSSGASASSGTAAPKAGSPALSAGSQPTQTVNVPHLSGGGLVMQPTLAVIGDSRSGGRSREVVLPLEDRSVMRQIAAALSMNSSGQPIVIQLHSDIPHTAKLISQAVRDNRAVLLASDSKRHTPRS